MKHKLKLNSKFMQGVMVCEVVKVYIKTKRSASSVTKEERIVINKDGNPYDYNKESFEKSFNRSLPHQSFKIIKL